VKLLDTTIAVDHLRGRSAAVELVTSLVESEERLVASELVRFELLSGARDSEADRLEDFFSVLGWVPVDAEVSRLGGQLARRYRKGHTRIDDVDYLIAATALLLDAALLTTNVRHFPMFERLHPPY